MKWRKISKVAKRSPIHFKDVFIFLYFRGKAFERHSIEICMWIEAHWKVLAFRYNGFPPESTVQALEAPQCISYAAKHTKSLRHCLCPASTWWLVSIFLNDDPKLDYYLIVSLFNSRHIPSCGTEYTRVSCISLKKESVRDDGQNRAVKRILKDTGWKGWRGKDNYGGHNKQVW